MKEEHIQPLQTRKRSQNGIPSLTRANHQVISKQHWNSPCPLFRPPVRPVLSVFTVEKKAKTLKKWVRKGSVEDWEEKAERSNAVRCGRGGAAALPWLQGEWNLWPCKGKGGVFFFFSFFFWRFAVLGFFGSQQGPWLQFWLPLVVPKWGRFPLSLTPVNKTNWGAIKNKQGADWNRNKLTEQWNKAIKTFRKKFITKISRHWKRSRA